MGLGGHREWSSTWLPEGWPGWPRERDRACHTGSPLDDATTDELRRRLAELREQRVLPGAKLTGDSRRIGGLKVARAARKLAKVGLVCESRFRRLDLPTGVPRRK